MQSCFQGINQHSLRGDIVDNKECYQCGKDINGDCDIMETMIIGNVVYFHPKCWKKFYKTIKNNLLCHRCDKEIMIGQRIAKVKSKKTGETIWIFHYLCYLSWKKSP